MTTSADCKNTTANFHHGPCAGRMNPDRMTETGVDVFKAASGSTGHRLLSRGRTGPQPGRDRAGWPLRGVSGTVGPGIRKARPDETGRSDKAPAFPDDSSSGPENTGIDPFPKSDEWLDRIPSRLSRKIERQLWRFPAAAWRGQLP
jgi:hypothetical protein